MALEVQYKEQLLRFGDYVQVYDGTDILSKGTISHIPVLMLHIQGEIMNIITYKQLYRSQWVCMVTTQVINFDGSQIQPADLQVEFFTSFSEQPLQLTS